MCVSVCVNQNIISGTFTSTHVYFLFESSYDELTELAFEWFVSFEFNVKCKCMHTCVSVAAIAAAGND